ncbi:MAG: hypothetical protein H0V61_05605 [Chitinophagales bacterium]|nr:hypothetical protein [Chitinophagales bacterium]
MKTFRFPNRLPFIALAVFLPLFFSACLKDSCETTYSYKLYQPVYMSYNDLRSAVNTLPATEIQNAGKIYYKAPYIFLNEVDKGIHIIDNTNPSSPQKIAFINIPGNIDIAMKDNILYADSYIDLVAIDVTNPVGATEVSRIENIFPQRTYTSGFTVDDDNGVVIEWVEKDTTITEPCGSNFSGPIFFDGFSSSTGTSVNGSSGGGSGSSTSAPGSGIAGSMTRFAIVENALYCLADASMLLFNIENASNPFSAGVVDMPWNIETIFPYNNYLFIGSTTGIQIYDNSNPALPVYVSQFVHATNCDPVVVQGNYAYSTLRGGTTCGGIVNQLDVIDLSTMISPQLVESYPMNNPYGLAIEGENLFVCDGSAGLKYYNAADPENLVLHQVVFPGETRDVIPLNGLLLAVTTDGFYEYDYTSGALQQLSFVPY